MCNHEVQHLCSYAGPLFVHPPCMHGVLLGHMGGWKSSPGESHHELCAESGSVLGNPYTFALYTY
jgi:hypothetical protein